MQEGVPIMMLRQIERQVAVSIIVPTLDEVDNVDAAVSSILSQSSDGLGLEILVADGGSRDGTIAKVRAWEGIAPVRLVLSDGKRGLAGDVLAAARQAAGQVVVVMDADLSHPPEHINDLVRPILDDAADLVVGSRYVAGGATHGWPVSRQILSRLGGLLAWPLTELKDPMSGYFAVRKDRLLTIDPQAAGFKIGLEIIAEGGGALRLNEVPIVFRDRENGESKIGWRQMATYARRLGVLAGGAVSLGNIWRFAAVGLIGVLVDLLVFELLLSTGLSLAVAHVASFVVATLSNYVLNLKWAFADRAHSRPEKSWVLYLRFLAVCILALSLRGGMLAGAVELLGWPAQAAIVLGIGVAAFVNYFGCAFFVFPSLSSRVPSDIRWRVAAMGLVAYVLVLRLIYMGLVNLLPEEAYYWNYAQHLDIGYLDHPPMVAWLVWLGTNLFGNTEFGVRVGATLMWLATAFFTFRLTRNLFGKSPAFVGVLFIATLPFFFTIGLTMTPDAPLTAAWAGTLCFLERALIAGQRRAWWGVGICMGLGLLSKYTIALLGPATLLFMLVEPQSRRLLARPGPYLAGILAAFLFSPVIAWNVQHGWASFAFQSTRRLQGANDFALPSLIVAMLVLLTPLGLLSIGFALRAVRRLTGNALTPEAGRRSLFVLIYTFVPLSVLVAFSLFHAVKLNWTGPLWLAALPAVAAVVTATGKVATRSDIRLQWWWAPTVLVLVVVYGLSLHYLVLGFPLVGHGGGLRPLPVGWKEFGQRAAALRNEIGRDEAKEPVLIGTDAYFLASEMAFYSRSDRGTASSVGRGALGGHSLMYNYWYKPEDQRGKTAILFALKREQVGDPTLNGRFARLGDIVEEKILKDGKGIGRFFYRVGYDLRPVTDEEAQSGAFDAPSD
ncbi:glycosyltransferase family 39 protein [Labrys sp. La1]|uniref:glycosyltransferase family 39 protein n=1 Tax=Labrys sp. La1 TaxID=3404917 RepID=UPI003EC04B03